MFPSNRVGAKFRLPVSTGQGAVRRFSKPSPAPEIVAALTFALRMRRSLEARRAHAVPADRVLEPQLRADNRDCRKSTEAGHPSTVEAVFERSAFTDSCLALDHSGFPGLHSARVPRLPKQAIRFGAPTLWSLGQTNSSIHGR